MKNNAGVEIKKLSFVLILVKTPKNISRASPADDRSKSGLKNKPTSKPTAPNISKIIT